MTTQINIIDRDAYLETMRAEQAEIAAIEEARTIEREIIELLNKARQVQAELRSCEEHLTVLQQSLAGRDWQTGQHE